MELCCMPFRDSSRMGCLMRAADGMGMAFIIAILHCSMALGQRNFIEVVILSSCRVAGFLKPRKMK